MTTPSSPHESAVEAIISTFACAVCQDARPLQTAIIPSGNCGHVHCKQCWDRWMDRQFGPETNGVQVMEGSITCPACREVSATPCGRPVALYAAPVGESEKVEDMLKQIEVFESRRGAIAQEMARIADDIKQWEQHAAEWSGHIDKVEDALKRLDAAKGKDLG